MDTDSNEPPSSMHLVGSMGASSIFMPLGALALVFSLLSEIAKSRGDHAESHRYVRYAMRIVMCACVVGIAFFILILAIVLRMMGVFGPI